MTVRIAQITDVHWQTTPSVGDLLGKRLLGSANLFLRGRAKEFCRDRQRALVRQVVALAPDVVVITGDLTAQALPAEFALARAELEPLLATIPTLVLAGNHDVYTSDAYAERRINATFGPWMHADGPIARLDVGPVTLLGIDSSRFHATASGWLPDDQLAALHNALDAPGLDGRAVILASHYPLVGPSGRTYTSWGHGLRNAEAVIDVLGRARHAPIAVVHGHKHHAYSAHIAAGERSIPSYDPGSGGLAHGAAIGLYTVDGATIGAERLAWDGEAFVTATWG